MDVAIVIVIAVMIIDLSITFFKTPKYRILEVTHKNGEIDYAVQVYRGFGIWVTAGIDYGLYYLSLRGCDLETAKRYVREFEEKIERKRGRKVIKTKVYEES